MLLREEAELYGDDYERRHNSSAQGQRITELEASLENVRVLLSEVNRDLEDTTKNYDIAVKKCQDADSDVSSYILFPGLNFFRVQNIGSTRTSFEGKNPLSRSKKRKSEYCRRM